MRQSLAVAQGLFAALVTCAPAVSRWPNPFLRRQDDDFDEYDLSYIKNVAAVGDSYSAGIGAGNKLGGWSDLGAWACSRYDASHPVLVSNYLTGLSVPLQFHSCSGHTIPEVLEGQMWRVSGGQDAIMISAGGNDAELVDILNQCVYQFFSPSNLAEWLAGEIPEVAELKELVGADTGKFARSCEDQLDNSEKIINDPAFTTNIQKLIDEAKLKLNPDGAIYYTGYAKFWDEKMEDLDWCAVPDHAWSMFPFLTASDHLGLNWQPKATLTVARRKKMNDLVDLVNGKIVEVVKNSGTNVFFVDYDRYFGEVGGRFCAPDIQEPKSDNDRLSFFELNADGFLGTSLVARENLVGDGMNDTVYARFNRMAEMADKVGVQYTDGKISKRVGPDLLPTTEMKDSFKASYGDIQPRNLFLPDGYGRVFHPSRSGHRIIAGKIIWHMAQYNAAKHGAGVNDETVDEKTNPAVCSIDDAPAPTPTKVIEVTPPIPPQGLTCTGVDNKKWVSRDVMNDAILKFCPDAVAQGGHDKDSGSLVREYNAGTADQLTISMDWPQEAKFTIELDSCLSKLALVMDSCDGNDPKNPMNWKHGGHNVVDYTTYNIFPSTKADRYKPGVCWLHIGEVQAWSGNDSPGFSRKWEYYIQSDVKDNDGTWTAGNVGGHLPAGDKNPLIINGLYAPFSMTPEAQGGDYIQFNIGSLAFTTKDAHQPGNVVPGCNVGGYDVKGSPHIRQMDCYFNC